MDNNSNNDDDDGNNNSNDDDDDNDDIFLAYTSLIRFRLIPASQCCIPLELCPSMCFFFMYSYCTFYAVGN